MYLNMWNNVNSALLYMQIVLRLSCIQSWIITVLWKYISLNSPPYHTKAPNTQRSYILNMHFHNFPLCFWAQEILNNQCNHSSIVGLLFGWSIKFARWGEGCNFSFSQTGENSRTRGHLLWTLLFYPWPFPHSFC